MVRLPPPERRGSAVPVIPQCAVGARNQSCRSENSFGMGGRRAGGHPGDLRHGASRRLSPMVGLRLPQRQMAPGDATVAPTPRWRAGREDDPALAPRPATMLVTVSARPLSEDPLFRKVGGADVTVIEHDPTAPREGAQVDLLLDGPARRAGA